jgi:aspartate-semialdehyde dehydrogenase
VLVAPHPIAVVLAEILHPLHRSLGVLDAVAMVLRPAADFGKSGIEELREQTTRLLRFESAPRETFGQQLAFNVLPQSVLPGTEGGLESRVAAEISSLLGWGSGRLAVRLVTVPVFLGHAICLRLRLERETGAPGVAAAVGGGRSPGPSRRKAAATPLAAPEERRTEVSDVAEDGTGGFWIWAIAGEVGAAAAAEAVLAAAAVADL